tara:strand:+ start:114 stop:779 length:666 start_codon:yes stop_codon:yes gene_type:complete
MTTNIQVFEVGGSVRDSLLGTPTKDRDFCAVCPSFESLKQWAQINMNKVFLIKEEFKTIRGIIGKDPIDIVMCDTSLENDLARRDFTMNALAYRVDQNLSRTGSIIDNHNGVRDIWRNDIRCIGEGLDSIEADRLRLLRAIRFKLTKDMRLSETLHLAMWDEGSWEKLMEEIAIERIMEELKAMLKFSTSETIKFFTTKCHPAATELLFSELWLRPTLQKK